MTSKSLRRVALGLAFVLPLTGLVVWIWVIPRVIVAAMRQRHEGYVTISGWWINGSSAGVTGLTLHEQPASSSPTWAAVDRVVTDLSFGAIVRGRFLPRRIIFERASIVYRIDANGNPLTQIPLNPSGGGAVPEIIVRDGTLAMRQEGRPEMRVRDLEATMGPAPGGPRFAVKANSDDWGHPSLAGRFTPDFSGFGFRLTADRLPADPEKARRVPFVEEKIWRFIEPHGPIGVVLDFQSAKPGGQDDVTTTVTFEGTTVGLPTLGLTGEEATGRLSVHDKIVTLDGVRGRMVGGRVAFSGPIDFQHKPDRYDLAMDLDGVDLAQLPEWWQLHRIGVRGRYTGKAGLRLALMPGGMDLTSSTAEGRIDGAEIRGIPLKRLELTMRGEGLRLPELPAKRREGEASAEPVGNPGSPGGSPSQAGDGARRDGEAPAEPSGGLASVQKEGPFLPQWIDADFRVNDVELKRALARVEVPDSKGGPREVPVSGRLALRASVRFPLGALDDLKAYTAHGSADVSGATIGGLDLGRLTARLDLAEGNLEVAGLRGRMVERPAGGGRPEPTEPPPAEGPLPRGGFRGKVHAELAGQRSLRLEMEGVELPIAELINVESSMVPPSAPPSVRGLPISGRLTIRASARAQGSDSWDPATWSLSGRAEIPEVSYRSTTARDVSAKLAIERGRLVLSDIAGRLGDADFRGKLGVELADPWPFDGELHTGDLPCQDVLGMVPHAPRSLDLEGTIAGRGEASGSLRPWRIASSGQAKVVGLKAGRVAIGDVPVRWTTRGETITVTAEEHPRYGGRVSAEARVPVAGRGPIEGTITLVKVDAAELSASAGESWKLTGHTDGHAQFRYAPGQKEHDDKDLPLEARAHLTAGDLTVRGVPARSVTMTLTVHQGHPKFDFAAEGLGGTIHLAGDGRLGSDPKDDEVRARVEALGLQLYEVWGALGTSGALADLRGRASIKGQVQMHGWLDGKHTEGSGSVELVEPIWGFDYRLGNMLRADVSRTPDGWRVGPLGGELFGGKVLGEGLWMFRDEGGQRRYGVDVRVERLMLARALSFLPEADRRFTGTGTLRFAGRSEGADRGTVEFRVDRGSVNSLELTGLRVPGEWTLSPGSPRRGTLHLRRADGQLAGGRVGGEAHFMLGDRRDFRARLFVDDVDLRVISRDEMGIRPVPGRLSGYVNLYGTDPAQPLSYRGDLEFDLNQASLVDIPLLDELNRSLGSAQGGVFDDGDIHATIVDRKVHINYLTLVGPLAQVHATGTVDFDGRLNLEVVVNNNRGIPQGGQVVLARSPNVAEEVARRASQIDQVRDFISSRLMKFRITGTIRDPIANVDRSINPRAAIGFFLKTVSLSARSQ